MAGDEDAESSQQRQRSVYYYQNLCKIGEGTHGSVFKARDVASGRIVAIKRPNPKFGLWALHNEILHLSHLHHPRIIKLHEVVADLEHDSVAIVMEHADTDLEEYMKSMPGSIPEQEVKRLMFMLFEGLEYLHGNGFVHRDIKSSNLLLTHDRSIKIADFGSCCKLAHPSSKLPYLKHFGTRCFRAPELVLPLKKYTAAIDIWAAGCVMANLLTKEFLFDAKDEKDLLVQILERVGMPKEKALPGLNKFLDGIGIAEAMREPSNKLRDRFPELSTVGFHMLGRLLEYDPKKRISAADALDHFWFNDLDLEE